MGAPTPLGDHAVVLGASMSGLLAARVLADFYRRVTIVERDVLAGDGHPRRGVPQGRHAHVLLPKGAKVLGDLFPGLLEELVAGGAPAPASLNCFHLSFNGHLMSREDAPADPLYGASRPFLESRVLERVRAMGKVTVLDRHDVVDLVTDTPLRRVTGTRIAARDTADGEKTLGADLVMAATGRSGRVGAWLSSLGYPEPVEEQVQVNVMYATRLMRIAPGAMGETQAVLIGPTADRPRGMGCFALENDRWVVTLAGFAGHHPPTEAEAWMDFARAVAPPELGAALLDAEPLDEIRTHRFPANLRRRYDKVDRFPEGLLVTGDAVCSFNPIYGQGMTVAALEAQALYSSLQGGIEGLAARFFKAQNKPVSEAWQFAVGADLSLPRHIVPGPRPLPVRAINAYVDRFQAAAEHDPVLAWHFLKVTGFDEPVRALFSPSSLTRMVMAGWRRRRTFRAPEPPRVEPA